MNSLSGPALVLKRARHLDHDARMTVFFRDHGKLAVVAKGGLRLQSKLKSLLEPFSETDLQVYVPEHGTYGRLAGGKLLDSHEALRARFSAYQLACRSCEMVDILIPFRAPSADVFDILRDALKALHAAESPETEWVHFGVRLLRCLGHGDLSEKLASLSLSQAMTHLDQELKRVLPWPMKSEIVPLMAASTT